jgi:SAM-dependent methyltransferase
LNQKGLDIVYQGHHNKRVDDKDEWGKRNSMYEIDRDFLLEVIDGGNILDIGCGGGFFLNKFDPRRWRRTGLEIDPDTVPFAKENFGIEVNVGTSEAMSFKDAQFDVVCFRGSFEHLVNPQITIQEVDRVLKQGGYLYLCVTPNVDSYCANLYREKWNQFDAKEHIFMFSVSTLQKLVSPFGFKKVSCEFFYLETPYADVENDISQVARDQVLINEGLNDEVDVSPPFWGNMMNVVFRKVGA